MDYDVLVDFLELMSSIETEIIDQVRDEAVSAQHDPDNSEDLHDMVSFIYN